MFLFSGIKGEAQVEVTPMNTADQAASGALPVFSTPAMIGLMEKAAHDSLLEYLSKGQGSVGTRIDIKHLSATPIGMKVRAKSEVTLVDGKRVEFKVWAYDDAGLIGEGVHERYIIDEKRFMEKCRAKLPGDKV